MPPEDFFNAIKDDAAAVASFATRPGLALVAGGLPIVVEGAVLGGLGVAGAMTERRIAGSRNKPSLQLALPLRLSEWALL